MKIQRQLILFGPPGTGKSYTIRDKFAKQLNVSNDTMFETTFHPSYTYSNFIGKIVPIKDPSGNIEYRYMPGIFLKALAKAFALCNKDKNVLLVIDEINRGEATKIFGDIFQLLDRNESGWSEYGVTLNDDVKEALLSLLAQEQIKVFSLKDDKGNFILQNNKIKLPPNLYIIATMNTSDESIYYMDSAFKRRWHWEYHNDGLKDFSNEKELDKYVSAFWSEIRQQTHKLMRDNSRAIHKIEDKLFGEFFLKEHERDFYSFRGRLMFFLWDSVFDRSKKPLREFLGLNEPDLQTFGDFTNHADRFLNKLIGIYYRKYNI